MGDYFAGTPLAGIKPAATLTSQQARYLKKFFVELLAGVSQRRKGILLTHNSLQDTIGQFFQLTGFDVGYEVPFDMGGFNSQKSIFDIVAEKGKFQFVVEVKPEVTTRDMGQVYGYVSTLKLSKSKAYVCLGTDILNYGDFVQGAVGKIARDLLERERFEIFLADKHALVEFGNISQLRLQEMPGIIISEEKIG